MYMYIVKTTCMIYFTCTLSYPLLHSLSPVTFPAARMRLAVSKSGSYAQPESALGETMVKAGADLGEESTFGKVMWLSCDLPMLWSMLVCTYVMWLSCDLPRLSSMLGFYMSCDCHVDMPMPWSMLICICHVIVMWFTIIMLWSMLICTCHVIVMWLTICYEVCWFVHVMWGHVLIPLSLRVSSYWCWWGDEATWRRQGFLGELLTLIAVLE